MAKSSRRPAPHPTPAPADEASLGGPRQQSLFATDLPPWEADDAASELIATVVLADGPPGPFDYRVPDVLAAKATIGKRLRVPFGKSNRLVTGYCVALDRKPAQRRLKEIRSVVDADPLLSPEMLELTRWMAERYLCTWGQAIEGVAPAAVRGQAGTREQIVLTLASPAAPAAKISTPTKGKKAAPPLTEKQQAVLKALQAAGRSMTVAELAQAAGCTSAPIMSLRKRGLILASMERVEQSQHHLPRAEPEADHALNERQQAALDAIAEALSARRHETVLMHGVTGSGKTEVYIRAIQEVLRFGRQAIVLVPEISLTPQTQQRFQARFERVAVLHSLLTPPERNWHWRRIARGEVHVVVGARSAVFAPVPRLGLIVIDEEHDTSFKQDSAPRYHAREVAERRCRQSQSPLVLGSATPSLESWRRAEQGEYRLVELPQRVLDRPLPDVAAIDLRAEFQDRRSRGAISRPLHAAIEAALREHGQIILLLNRRGFSTTIQCPSCGEVEKCPDCDVSLTHHRSGGQAVCHYCDYRTAAPAVCSRCGYTGIIYSGLGTQRLEAEVRSRFPGLEVLRMDSDTMDRPGSHEQALARFRSGEVQILLGTQMIAKGLDFPNVTLVGVVNADLALHFPDFRAAERTFQLVTQVAGRTGRGRKGGRVLVQTFSPEHPAIQAALKHDYRAFAGYEMPIREQFGYPPMSDLIRLVVRGPSQQPAEAFAEHLVEQIRRAAAEREIEMRLLGPAPAPISRLKALYRFHAMAQSKDGENLRRCVAAALADAAPPRDVQWIVDVDPQSML